MNSREFYRRRAGVLLHPTSLPSGTIDSDAERWLEFMHDAGLGVWQVLPLGDPQEGLCPYQCVSNFAINPRLITVYEPVDRQSPEFINFCIKHRDWLFDYSLYKVLKQINGHSPWYEWTDEWKYRQLHAMQDAEEMFEDELAQINWQQFQLHNRWKAIKESAVQYDIQLFGDMPLYVAHDSADVWAHPERFMLDENGQMTAVTGVPPDYYSETGQRWGSPHYDWDVLRRANYDWWLYCIDHHLELFDILRIDHFRGLESAWVIDPACETAVDGYWKEIPGDELLTRINQDVGYLPIVAEDLGIITEAVTKLRKKHQIPGMAVMQFGFDAHEDNPNALANIQTDCVVYTGTHDNDTTAGWYDSLDDHTKQIVTGSLGIHGQDNIAMEVVNQMIHAAMNSRASLCMIPLQDFLHLGADARMNTPGTTEGNWSWSFQWDQVPDNQSHVIKEMVKAAGRLSELNES